MDDPIDEGFELRAATVLAGRGLALALLAGLLWHVETGYRLPDILLRIVSAFAALFAVMPLAPASMVYRNVTCRALGVRDGKTTVVALGIAIFALLLGLATLVFQLAATVWH